LRPPSRPSLRTSWWRPHDRRRGRRHGGRFEPGKLTVARCL
jgi:hypothetical protein